MEEFDIESVADIDRTDIDDFVEIYLVGKVGGSTIERYYLTIGPLFNFLERRGTIDENPFEETTFSYYQIDASPTRKEEGDPVYIEPEDKEELVRNVRRPKIRNKLIINLMWSTGIRSSGAVNIELEDIDFQDRSISLPAEKNKSKASRRVWYDEKTSFLLDKWVNGGYRTSFPHSNSSYLLVSRKAEQIRAQAINRMVKNAAENAGLQEQETIRGVSHYDITSHVLRHSYGVQKARSGMPIKQLAMLMGHSDTSTTEKYMKLADRDLRQAAKNHEGDVSLDNT